MSHRHYCHYTVTTGSAIAANANASVESRCTQVTTLNARWNWVRVRNIVKRLLVPYRLCAIVRVYDKSPKGLLILRGRTEGRDMEFKSRLLRRMTQEQISALSGVRQVVGLMSLPLNFGPRFEQHVIPLPETRVKIREQCSQSQ